MHTCIHVYMYTYYVYVIRIFFSFFKSLEEGRGGANFKTPFNFKRTIEIQPAGNIFFLSSQGFL